MRLLEEAGVIKGYVAVVDQVAVGLPVSVFASIKLERQREEELDRFAEAVARWPEVVDCYLMTGQRDYLLRIVVAGPRSLRALPQGEADPPRRRRLDRIELRAEAS